MKLFYKSGPAYDDKCTVEKYLCLNNYRTSPAEVKQIFPG